MKNPDDIRIKQYPLISVIVPVYKVEKYIRRCLDSIIHQTYTNLEIILVDDGSPDKCGEICDEICNTDSRFRVFHTENNGVSAARNLGIDKSLGEYITFIDADDRIHPNHIKNLYRCISENDVDIVISGFKKCWLDSDKTQEVKFNISGKYRKNEILPQFAIIQRDTGLFGYTFSKLFRKKLIEKIRFDIKLTLAEDFDFYLKLYRKAEYFYFDDKCYYFYSQATEHSLSAVGDYDIDYFKQLTIRLRYRQFLIDEKAYSDNNKQIIDETVSNYVYFVLFYSPISEIKKYYNELITLVAQEDFIFAGKTAYAKWILFLFKHRMPNTIKISMKLYRIMAFVKNKLKQVFFTH